MGEILKLRPPKALKQHWCPVYHKIHIVGLGNSTVSEHIMYCNYRGCSGGGVDWVASHPPWVWSVYNIIVWALADLLEQAILVNKVYDEMQINHSDRALHYGDSCKSMWIDTKQLTCPNEY